MWIKLVKKHTKPKKKGGIKTCGYAKVFKYNAGIDAVVDGNSVQMAFVREYKGVRRTAIEYDWYSHEKGELVKRGLYVSGHGEYGIPTLKEYDIYVALQRIFINKKTKRGLCELRTDDITDEYLTINYTLNELAKELGYSTPNKTTRENLKKSINILVATTFFSRHSGGIYDIRNKAYVVNANVGVHLIESIQSLELTGQTQSYDITKIRLSRFTYYQILNDYKLFYNKNTYNKTKNLIAKKLYHMALQWKGKNKYSYANLTTLAERIPMIDTDDKYKKRDIKLALDILDRENMVKIKYDDNNPDKVYFIFDGDIKCIEEKIPMLEKYNTYREIKERFYEFNFSNKEIEKYLDVEQIRYIQALLRYIDERLQNKSIKNPKSYLKRCITNPLKNLSKVYFNKKSD